MCSFTRQIVSAGCEHSHCFTVYCLLTVFSKCSISCQSVCVLEVQSVSVCWFNFLLLTHKEEVVLLNIFSFLFAEEETEIEGTTEEVSLCLMNNAALLVHNSTLTGPSHNTVHTQEVKAEISDHLISVHVLNIKSLKRLN